MRGIARLRVSDGLPTAVRLLTQTIFVDTAPNLHTPASGWTHGDPEEAVEPHAHRAYGVYSESEQRITLDESLHFERLRETFLHENLHAILSVSNLDAMIEGTGEGFSEHVVSTLAPILLAWLRDNPYAVLWLQQTQEVR